MGVFKVNCPFKGLRNIEVKVIKLNIKFGCVVCVLSLHESQAPFPCTGAAYWQ